MAPTVEETASAALQAYSRVEKKPYIIKTALLLSRTTTTTNSAEADQITLLFKTENSQRTGSFKFLGYCLLGKRAIGAACAASILGSHLTGGLPENVVQAKLEKTNVYGVEVILHGAETGLAEQYAQSLAGTGRYTYISPYGDPDVIAGEGTVAVEILEQCKDINANGNGTVGIRRVVDNFFVAMSGGGLIRGMGSVMKVLGPSTKVYGGSAVNSMALPASTKAGSVVEDEHRETLADAVAGPLMEIRLRCRWPWWLWMLLWSVRKGEFRKRSGSLRPGEDVG